MDNVYSKHLKRTQLMSLQRLGDFYIPGNTRMPSFSAANCIRYVDVVLDEVDADDVYLMGWLLLLLRWAPGFIIEFLLTTMDHHHRYPEWIAGPLRLMSLALKGITMSLYYSGLSDQETDTADVHQLMGYELHCEPDAEQKLQGKE
ncbi:MAG: hypothetical protein MI976_07670 [Pseudomonadales bacterium]|nr:hypothetical protein [Pseudomonadales bacterium]